MLLLLGGMRRPAERLKHMIRPTADQMVFTDFEVMFTAISEPPITSDYCNSSLISPNLARSFVAVSLVLVGLSISDWNSVQLPTTVSAYLL